MNILFINYSLQAQGGSQMTSSGLAEALVRRGHALWFGGAPGPLAERLRPLGIEVLDLPLNRRFPSLSTLSVENVRRIARLLTSRRIEVIHAFQYPAVLAAASAVAAARVTVPVYFSVLGPDAPSFRLPPGVVHCFPVSEEMRAKVLKARTTKADRLTVLPHRLDLRRYGEAPADPELPVRMGWAREARRVCLVSTLRRHKMGPVRALLAAAPALARRHGDIEILFAGDGPFREEVESAAAAVNRELGRKVVMTAGTLEVSGLLRHLSVVVAMGRGALEAMAAGVPVVVAGPSGYAGVASPENLEALAVTNLTGRGLAGPGTQREQLERALDSLLSDAERMKRVGEAARAFVRRAYDVEIGAGILEEHYARALGSPESTRVPARSLRLIGFFAHRLAVAAARRVRIALFGRRVPAAGGTRGAP